MAQFTTVLGVMNTSGVWEDLIQSEKNNMEQVLLLCNYVTTSMAWSMMQGLIKEDVRAAVMVRNQTWKPCIQMMCVCIVHSLCGESGDHVSLFQVYLRYVLSETGDMHRAEKIERKAVKFWGAEYASVVNDCNHSIDMGSHILRVCMLTYYHNPPPSPLVS